MFDMIKLMESSHDSFEYKNKYKNRNISSYTLQ